VAEQKILRTSRSYDITLKIKGESYTNDITNVRISSSLSTGYQIVTITIKITPQTILLNKLYGQDSIDLVINKLDASEFITETMKFDLMVVTSEFEVPVSDLITTGKQMDRSSFDLITVNRIPFQIMTSLVGVIFGPLCPSPWTAPITIKNMIESIVNNKVDPKPILELDTDNINTEPISQCCIPPTTLMKAIHYLDHNYGIFNGAPAIFCDNDNKLKIMNLSAKIKKNYSIYVEHLTTQHSEKDITKASEDKKYFYTYDNLFTNYIGNAKFGTLGKKLKHIVLPSNTLSHTIEQDLTEVCKKYGVIGQTKGEASYINTTVAKRTRYYIENNGQDKTEVHANSKIAKQIADLSRMSFMIERNLAIEELIKIGEVVKVGTKTQEHLDISGKYILFSSDLIWNKQSEWQTTARLELIRTNKTV